MKHTTIILAIAFIIIAITGYVVDAERTKWKREAERYRELYLNCKINHDLHMKQCGTFEPM